MNRPSKPPRRRVDGVLLLDKPAGMTSNAALQKVRRLFNAAKAGHTGTLDPMATGLLPLCFGEATKFAGELLAADKRYAATVRLGVRTDTADAEGRILETRPVAVTREQLEAVLARFRGDILQVPPMHSALKRDGRPLYEYARKGIELERAPRAVTIHSLNLRFFEGDRIEFDVDCSKGTYIRTLAQDIGEALGCGGFLASLRRMRIGNLQISSAVALDELESRLPEAREALLSQSDSLLAGLPEALFGPLETGLFLHGQGIPWLGETGQRYRCYGAGGAFLGLGEISAEDKLVPRRLMAAC